jgi:hypothetical protein
MAPFFKKLKILKKSQHFFNFRKDFYENFHENFASRKKDQSQRKQSRGKQVMSSLNVSTNQLFYFPYDIH